MQAAIRGGVCRQLQGQRILADTRGGVRRQVQGAGYAGSCEGQGMQAATRGRACRQPWLLGTARTREGHTCMNAADPHLQDVLGKHLLQEAVVQVQDLRASKVKAQLSAQACIHACACPGP